MNQHPEAQSALIREGRREQIARAIHDADYEGVDPRAFEVYWNSCDRTPYYRRADAVLAALAPSPEDVALIAEAHKTHARMEDDDFDLSVRILIKGLAELAERAYGLTPEEGGR